MPRLARIRFGSAAVAALVGLTGPLGAACGPSVGQPTSTFGPTAAFLAPRDAPAGTRLVPTRTVQVPRQGSMFVRVLWFSGGLTPPEPWHEGQGARLQVLVRLVRFDGATTTFYMGEQADRMTDGVIRLRRYRSDGRYAEALGHHEVGPFRPDQVAYLEVLIAAPSATSGPPGPGTAVVGADALRGTPAVGAGPDVRRRAEVAAVEAGAALELAARLPVEAALPVESGEWWTALVLVEWPDASSDAVPEGRVARVGRPLEDGAAPLLDPTGGGIPGVSAVAVEVRVELPDRPERREDEERPQPRDDRDQQPRSLVSRSGTPR